MFGRFCRDVLLWSLLGSASCVPDGQSSSEPVDASGGVHDSATSVASDGASADVRRDAPYLDRGDGSRAASGEAGVAVAADDGAVQLDAQQAVRDGAANGAEAGVVDPGRAGDGDFKIGPSYTRHPDLTDKGAPKGRLFGAGDTPIVLSSMDSKIFQGSDSTLLPQHRHAFTRRLQVYIPAQYKDGAEAPLLVIQDGPGPITLVSRALDNLTISSDPARKLPPFIVVAVGNGGSDSKGSERGLEYDTMSDRYARFIDSEVLPAVLEDAAIKASYPKLAITKDPEGRAAMGCSSGGAAAFTMGWFRPDLFRRVISYSGTLVDQQDDDAPEEAMFPLGAWEYHSGKSLIANAAQKPLRIFLHVSDMDLGHDAPESGHHNWLLANQRAAAALKAKGYHYRFVTATSAGHCEGKIYDASLADTLVWVWRGYAAN
jgi:enterochelin esterase-like enzyme